MTDVFYNGKYVGNAENSKDFMEKMKEKRRLTELPTELSVSYESERDIISLTTEIGRIMRPLIIINNFSKKKGGFQVPI